MRTDDTIIALSSAAGSARRAIVRLSGAGAFAALGAVAEGEIPARFPAYFVTRLRAPLPAVRCAVMAFKGPRSFTGQDVAELHLPGSAALVRMVMERAMGVGGVRAAEAGEFSARAFFNGKIDLTEAEGIAAVISAGDARQLRAATSLREGALHQWVIKVAETLGDMLARIEAGIDFVEEEHVAFISAAEVAGAAEELRAEMARILAESPRVDRTDALPTVVLVGLPNVGKSSLINALSGERRAIESAAAGTTRDMLSAVMRTGRGDVRLVDVPGEEPESDELRVKMMAARRAAMMEADLIVRVSSPGERIGEARGVYGARVVEVMNKADLMEGADERISWRCVSAKTGAGIAELREMLAQMVTEEPVIAAQQIVLNQRHRQLLDGAREHLEMTRGLVEGGILRAELVAAELRLALDLIGQISGAISPDEILGRVFARFCIGK